jgi:hypothetical protein
MKRRILLRWDLGPWTLNLGLLLVCGCLAAAIAAALGVAPLWQTPPPTRPLQAIAPAGALLVLESPDFAALVRDWDGSREKQLWLASANFQEFSRSRLYLRLQEAQQEFAAAGGIPPDMALVRSVAGGDSLLAIYDIGKLELLYVTRMPAARAAATLLSQARSKFEPRNAAGTPYYLKFDSSSGRAVAFATVDDLLLLGTREDLIAGALELLAGRSASGAPITPVKNERWYAESVKAAGQAGELRMVMNLEALVRSPYFRSYWIQRNVSEVKSFYAGVCDLRRLPNEIREERVLLRGDVGATPSGRPSPTGIGPSGTGDHMGSPLPARPGVDTLLALVPDDAGLYRAWSSPAAGAALELLAHKILAPRPEGQAPSRVAPRMALTGGETGSEADLETSIDEAPPENAGAVFVPGPLSGLLQAAGLQGMLQVESTRRLPAGVFVRSASVVALLGSSDWDDQAARDALLAAVEGLWSRQRLGMKWTAKKRGARTWYALDGLAPLAMAAESRWLLIANDADLLAGVLDRLKPTGAAAPGKVFAAGFRHSAERANFAAMMSAIDHVSAPAAEGPEEGDAGNAQAMPARAGPAAPAFFSGNIASLSDTLARLESSSIEIRDNGSALNETVIYKLSK